MKLLEATFEAIHGETQPLFVSDWPHWHLDVPGKLAGLPFLSEQARRNIVGENARRLFEL
jgi:predicted TIM-barrel fold metal-dependent hydrolase